VKPSSVLNIWLASFSGSSLETDLHSLIGQIPAFASGAKDAIYVEIQAKKG
jgi:hypothetical protein